MYWLYWDMAWSIVFGGIMFATIVAHPDAEFLEIQPLPAWMSHSSRFNRRRVAWRRRPAQMP